MTIDELTLAQWEGAQYHPNNYGVQDIVIKVIPADDLEAIEWTPNAEASSRLITCGSAHFADADCYGGHVRNVMLTMGTPRRDQGVGHAVALSARGDVVAVGAPGSSGGDDADKDTLPITYGTITSITQSGTDIEAETPGANWFGYSVSMNLDGSILAVGANINADVGPQRGHVRVYKFSNDDWSQLGADIDGESNYDYFGESVSLSLRRDDPRRGGRYNDGSGSDSGHARVFQWSSDSWTQIGSDIDGEAANDQSGRSVS